MTFSFIPETFKMAFYRNFLIEMEEQQTASLFLIAATKAS